MGAAGGARSPCGVAAQVAVKLKCPKPTLLSLFLWIPIASNAELIGKGRQNVLGMIADVGCLVEKEVQNA